MKIYRNINKLHTFKGFLKEDGRCPNEKGYSVVKDGAFVSEKGVVVWVGKDKDLKHFLKNQKITKRKEIDLKKQNVFPSFTESHTHLAFGGDRKKEFEEKIKGATYQEIQKSGGGIVKTVKDTKKESLENLKSLCQKRANKFKKQGVTLLEVKSGYGQNLKTEAKQIEATLSIKGLQVVPTYLGLHSFDSKKTDKKAYVDKVLNEDLLRLVKQFPELRRLDAFIEKNFFTLSDLKRFVKTVEELGLSFCAHVDQLSPGKGALTAASLGALSVEHAVHLKAEEIKALSNFNTVMNLLPAADFYLNTEYPKARDLIDAGNRVSLATDYNPGSSPTKDLSFVGVLARRQMKMTLPEVWCAYTLNASKALGIFNKGVLTKGFKSEFFTTQGEVHDFFYEIGDHPVGKVYT